MFAFKRDEWKQPSLLTKGVRTTVMFFGLTNFPATFQMMMNAIFQKEIHEGWLIIYMDDMLIATDGQSNYHQKCVHRVLTKTGPLRSVLKPEKCVFEQNASNS